MKCLSLIFSFVVCICIANTNNVFAQKREFQQFKGKVTNLQGDPIFPVNIIIPGISRGTVSDKNGNFTIKAKNKETLRFSYIGMKDVLIQLNEDSLSELLVQMEPETYQLSDIIVEKKLTVHVNDEDMPDEYIFDIIECYPEFPGGLTRLKKFLKENLQYPEEAFQAGEEGQVTVDFTIDKSGNVSNARVTKSVSTALDKEALRIIQSLPRWKPGMQRGRPVEVHLSLPVDFVIYLD